MKQRAFFLLLPLLALVATPSAQTVHVVDQANGPGTDFTDLTSAVAAASDGDVLLVRSGDYADVLSLSGKGLVVTADAGASVSVSEIVVENLTDAQFAAVRGIDVTNAFSAANSLCVLDCEGAVWMEDIEVATGASPFVQGSAFVRDCSTVVFNGCRIDPPVSSLAFATFLIQRAAVHLYETEVTGISFGTAVFFPSAGSPAVSMTDGELYLHAATLTGGKGSDGSAIDPNAGDGGPGLLADGVSAVTVVESTVQGGASGTPAAGGVAGQSGAAFEINGGTLTQLPNTARLFATPSPIREDATTSVDFVGDAGDLVFVAVAAAPRSVATTPGSLVGPLLLESPLSIVPFGTLPASGQLSDSFPVPDISAGAAVRSFYMQGLFVNVLSGELALGSPTQVQLLDSSF